TKAGASKFDGGVDLLDLGHAVFSHAPERQLPPLCEWNLLDGHLDLRRDWRGLNLALFSAELVNALLEEHDPHPELFDRLRNALSELGTDAREETFLAFELDVLREAGILPELGVCVSCGREIAAQAYFSPGRGGAVCVNCEGAYPDRLAIDPRLLRVASGLLALPRTNGKPLRLPHLTRLQTDPLNRLLVELVEHTLSKGMRMSKYVVGK
ncbi:MAG: DNA repair protein RecO, partial [Tepidisphaeraceae bacterium]